MSFRLGTLLAAPLNRLSLPVDRFPGSGHEDYTTEVRGVHLKVVVTVTFNEAGQAQHLVVNHRPRSALLFLSRLMGEKFAGTPIAEHFLTSAS